MGRPSGTVTFLFTDIEASTRRWEADADSMRVELAAHDEVLRNAVERHGGWLFKHTGDGVCAAFASPRGAIDAAVDAQRALGLPVRMGVATGEAEQRGDDYFGPVLNRSARVMAVGHGGQVLVSASTAGLLTGVDLWDLGTHRLRDLSGVEHLFQVRADGLAVEFPRLLSLDAVSGNLPGQTTSFVGRDVAVKELAELVRAHRLVTVTGVGGVGKTRLAVQVAKQLALEFGDGVWFVELAPVGDPGAVPDAVATGLGITPQPGKSVTDSVADALVGRRLLVVLDNCEHVLDAAADLIEAILTRSTTVTVIATSREGLRVGAEHLWPVPSLDMRGGADSEAVQLFVERAQAVVPGFALDDAGDVEAVTEICRRLDGIALAIELAAARMVSMTPVEVSARLNDGFRVLSGSRRGLERHQTLRQAVQWSYDLLTDDERAVLGVCGVFAGGFDAVSVTVVSGRFDEDMTLDALDSLVRKSLVTTTRADGRTRYGMLETIRQFTEDHHATTDGLTESRDRHARHFASQAVTQFEKWDGPGFRGATDWVTVEFENLRAGFRWATDRGDLPTAAMIAAHTAVVASSVQQFEPIAWAEELLPAAATAQLTQLPRLYHAASHCNAFGRPADALAYAQAAVALQADPRFQPFPPEWASYMEAIAHLYNGRADRFLEICADLASGTGVARVVGLCGLTTGLSLVGRSEEAMAIADDTIAAARAHANPFFIAYASLASGLAFTETDPARALETFREGVAYSGQHQLWQFEAQMAGAAAPLESVHGELDHAMTLFKVSIDAFLQYGGVGNLVWTLVTLAQTFSRIDRREAAATICGALKNYPVVQPVNVDAVVEHLRTVLDADTFADCFRIGAAMNLAEAVQYAHHHIELTRQHQP